jgi:hypothetical protein
MPKALPGFQSQQKTFYSFFLLNVEQKFLNGVPKLISVFPVLLLSLVGKTKNCRNKKSFGSLAVCVRADP